MCVRGREKKLMSIEWKDNKFGHEGGRSIGEALKTNTTLTSLNISGSWFLVFLSLLLSLWSTKDEYDEQEIRLKMKEL